MSTKTLKLVYNPNNLGDSDDVANGVFTPIDDSYANQDSPNSTAGGGDNLYVESNSPNDNFFHTETVLTDNNLITVTTKWKEWWGKEYEIILVDKYIP